MFRQVTHNQATLATEAKDATLQTLRDVRHALESGKLQYVDRLLSAWRASERRKKGLAALKEAAAIEAAREGLIGDLQIDDFQCLSEAQLMALDEDRLTRYLTSLFDLGSLKPDDETVSHQRRSKGEGFDDLALLILGEDAK